MAYYTPLHGIHKDFHATFSSNYSFHFIGLSVLRLNVIVALSYCYRVLPES